MCTMKEKLKFTPYVPVYDKGCILKFLLSVASMNFEFFFCVLVVKNMVFAPYWFLHKSLQMNLYGLQCVCFLSKYLQEKSICWHIQKNTGYEIHYNP